MPRKDAQLTVDQINEFLSLTEYEQNETVRAVRDFLISELERRKQAGKRGGRPKSPIDAKTRNREAVAKHRARKKALINKAK